MKERIDLLLTLQEKERERLFLVAETEFLQGLEPSVPHEVFLSKGNKFKSIKKLAH